MKVTASLAKHTTTSPRELARSRPQRLKNVIQNNGGTLDIDVSTVVEGNNVHKTGKLSLTSDSYSMRYICF